MPTVVRSVSRVRAATGSNPVLVEQRTGTVDGPAATEAAALSTEREMTHRATPAVTEERSRATMVPPVPLERAASEAAAVTVASACSAVTTLSRSAPRDRSAMQVLPAQAAAVAAAVHPASVSASRPVAVAVVAVQEPVVVIPGRPVVAAEVRSECGPSVSIESRSLNRSSLQVAVATALEAQLPDQPATAAAADQVSRAAKASLWPATVAAVAAVEPEVAVVQAEVAQAVRRTAC